MTKFSVGRGCLAFVIVWKGLLGHGSLPAQADPGVLTLVEVQRRAIETSPVLREYRSRKAESRFKVDEAYTQVHPTLNLNSGYTRLTPTLTALLGPQRITFIQEYNYDMTISLRQALYTFGRLHWAAASAQLQERSSQAELAYQQARVLEDASVAFFEARQAQEQTRVAADNLKARQGHLHDAQAQVKQGAAAPFDAIRDDAAVAVAEQAVLDAEKRRELALEKLCILIGAARQGQHLDDQETPLPPPPGPGQMEKTLESRQDLVAARFARDAARARIELAGAANNPSLSLQSDFIQRNAVAFNPAQQWSVGVVFGIPLYDGGLTQTRIDQAKEVAEQLDAIYENSQRNVRLEVESYYLELLSGWKKIDAAKRSLASSQESARLAALRYQNGLSPNVERLDAEAALSQAQFDLVQARYQYLIAWAHYQRAGGQA